MRALVITLALACAGAVLAGGPPNHPKVEDVLKTAWLKGRGGASDPLKIRHNHPTDFGNAFKASVMPLIDEALVENPEITVGPWYPVSGWKIHMTYRKDDNKVFSGETLFNAVGRDIFGATSTIDTPLDPADASMGTYRDYYGGRFNHLQPDRPARFADLIDDNKITAASVANVLERFPYYHPSEPYRLLNEDQFKRLKKVYYDYKKKHTEFPYVSLLLPFAVPKLTGEGQSDPLLRLDEVISNFNELKNGGKPRFRVPDAKYSEPADGQGRWAVGGAHYTFKVKYDYFFQQVPSRLDIDQLGAGTPGQPPKTMRNRTNDFEGPMALFMGPDAPTFLEPNADNNIAPLMKAGADGLVSATWLEELATQQVPADASPFKPGYEGSGATFFKKVSTGEFVLTRKDLEALNTDPSQSRLAVKYAPHPTVAFAPQHFADRADATPVDMENELVTANPPVAVKKMRQGSMQVYVVAYAEVYKNNLADANNPGELVASYRVIDDNYILTPFVKDQFDTLEKLNASILAEGLRGGTYVKNGDPYDRQVDFKRKIIPTPAIADTRLGGPDQRPPEDKLMAYFPDPRTPDGQTFLKAVEGKEGPPEPGNPNSLGDAFFEAHVGRGPSFNYVFDRNGTPIDPNRNEPPQKYWPNPQHIAVVWPYRVKTPAGGETVVGPYILDLSACQSLAARNGNAAKFVYQYAMPPWHENDKDKAEDDKCIPVVVAEPLRSVLNKLIDNPGIVEVHMTADASDKWGKPQNPGGMPEYKYCAELQIVDANKEPMNSLVLRVPASDIVTHELIPQPGSFVPLIPAFPNYQGRLPDTARAALNPTLTVASDGSPAKPEQYFVAAYDCRIRTSGDEPTQSVPVPGLPETSRDILSANSTDMTVKAQVVDGCGRITTLASDKVAGVPLFRPSASVTFVPTDDPGSAWTVGVPIAAKHFIPMNEGARMFASAAPMSLGARINDLNRPNLIGNLSPEFDGTEAPGSDKNPGDEFFRPPDPNRNRVVKGRAVRLEILAESQVQPGFNIYDTDNTGGADRARYKNSPYAAFIRRIDIAVYPPGSAARANDVPEKKANLFYFNTATDLSASVAPPPMATFEYNFREATSSAPTAKGKVPDDDRHYTVRLDLEDMAGNSRAMKFPIWVTDEGVQTDKISTEHQRK